MISVYEDVKRYVAIACARPGDVTSSSITTAYIHARQGDGVIALRMSDLHYAISFDGVRGHVEKALRVLHPDDDPEALDDEQLAMDLPEEKLLQQRYSLTGEGGGKLYRERVLCSEDDMHQVCDRFRRIGKRYFRHADAFEAWWYREHGAVEVHA